MHSVHSVRSVHSNAPLTLTLTLILTLTRTHARTLSGRAGRRFSRPRTVQRRAVRSGQHDRSRSNHRHARAARRRSDCCYYYYSSYYYYYYYYYYDDYDYDYYDYD